MSNEFSCLYLGIGVHEHKMARVIFQLWQQQQLEACHWNPIAKYFINLTSHTLTVLTSMWS